MRVCMYLVGKWCHVLWHDDADEQGVVPVYRGVVLKLLSRGRRVRVLFDEEVGNRGGVAYREWALVRSRVILGE